MMYVTLMMKRNEINSFENEKKMKKIGHVYHKLNFKENWRVDVHIPWCIYSCGLFCIYNQSDVSQLSWSLYIKTKVLFTMGVNTAADPVG